MVMQRDTKHREPRLRPGRGIFGLVGLLLGIAVATGATAQNTVNTQIQTRQQQQQQEQQNIQNRSELDPDQVVARVDDMEIKLIEVMAAYQALGERVRQIPFAQAYPQVLNLVIRQRLLARAARERDLDETEEHRQRMEIFENQLLQEAFLRDIYENQVTEEALRARYDELVQNYQGPEEVRSSHILVATEEQARALIQELQGGADFAALAREHSTDASKENGGDLGYLTREQMVGPYAEAAFSLQPGQVTSEPVQTAFGWHVIKVMDRRRRPAPEFEQVQRQVRIRVAQEIAESQAEEMAGQSTIERFNMDGSPLQQQEQQEQQSEE